MVPALLALEAAGYEVTQRGELMVARRDDEEFVAEDPVLLLGLIALVRERGWDWGASDEQIDAVRHRLGLF